MECLTVESIRYLSYTSVRYNKLAEMFIDEYLNFKVKSKSEFCKKYKISRNTLNKYLTNLNEYQQNNKENK